MSRILLGVRHSEDEKRFTTVTNTVGLYLPKRAGLELPEDYLEDERNGFGAYFFGRLATYLRTSGVDVVPLEDRELFYHYWAVQLAEDVTSRRLTKMGLESQLRAFERRTGDKLTPNRAYNLRLYTQRYRTALQILEHAQTPEQMAQKRQAAIDRRERHVLGTIKATHPDMVIIGDAHAKNMRPRLAEYEYVSII